MPGAGAKHSGRYVSAKAACVAPRTKAVLSIKRFISSSQETLVFVICLRKHYAGSMFEQVHVKKISRDSGPDDTRVSV